MMPEEVALVHAFYRTSVKARRDLGKALLHNKPVIDMDKTYDSRVAQFFAIILKSLGFELRFLDSDDDLYSIDNSELRWYSFDNGKSAICTEYDKYLLDRRYEIAQEILEEYGILNKEELEEMIDEEIETRDYLMGVYDENKDFYKNCIDLPLPERQPQSMEEINVQLVNLMDVEIDLAD